MIVPVLHAVVGVALVVILLWDAFETILVPRRIGRRIRLTRWFYLVAWRLWRALALAIRKPSRREYTLALFGPLSLIGLLACWAGGLVLAFAFLQSAVAMGTHRFGGSFTHLLYMSGETFFTLGFGDVTPTTALGRGLAVLEAGMGFGFLGTVIGYLPTMYAAFAQREVEISLMDARAGSPPTAAELLRRVAGRGHARPLDELMRGWERWSAQLLETHISYPQLAYYRSQHVNQSWLATLTAVLDTSAVVLSRVDDPSVEQARLTFAMARHALVDVTQIFVQRFPGAAADRLPALELGRLRARLAGTPGALPETAGFETRLAELRRLYEPYAQALAAFLLFELPPWVVVQPRRDNWEAGPWDRQLASRGPAHVEEEHF